MLLFAYFNTLPTSLGAKWEILPNVSVLRVIRIVRLIRFLKVLPGMKKILLTFVEAIPSLATIGIVTGVFLLLYGILGIHLFSGLLENRCRFSDHPIEIRWPANPEISNLCGTFRCPLG